MDIEVCYADPARATRIDVTLAEGSTVADAVAQSGIVDGDRVELLRPLIVDPKEARRRRAMTKAARAK